MRTGKKYVEAVFKRFCEAMGKHVAEDYKDVGGYSLDHNSIYGGYVIEEIHGASGGVDHPFGSNRMKAGAFTDAMHFAMRAIEKL